MKKSSDKEKIIFKLQLTFILVYFIIWKNNLGFIINIKVRIMLTMCLLLGGKGEIFSQLFYVQDLYLESVKQNNISKAKEYLDVGMNVNITSPNYTSVNALMIAVKK